ncbi:ABC transporter permease [Oceanicella actignis]|uniref:ABC-2 type transport system permease protein n=1 Tax=Oceanicella actignis TaxID=1189325 RepID=A0A1M7TN13_9RHOB|nr:ABC transporter permease [Oceanicella actignis]SET71959.1 ABC-2 type transport system permease protein [Oceanicella actignis]SHN72095.1 ABC-2 type transport system permease protein [Oceanicella actignis]
MPALDLRKIWRMGLKELRSLARDPVLVLLILYTFTFAIHAVAHGVRTELRDVAVAVVDEDRSALSRRIAGAFLPPYFQPPRMMDARQADAEMDAGRITFALRIPPGFEADLLAGRVPQAQLLVDATAMSVAGAGTRQAAAILRDETAAFLGRGAAAGAPAIAASVRASFNPNLESAWFVAVMQVVNNVTILAVILSGAAVIRERERGTIEHLMTLPLRPAEVMLAKIWANGLVIVAAAVLSLELVVRGSLGVGLAGSSAFFALGAAVYLFAACALGVMLSTVATTMPQFGLLAIPVFVVMNLLSGGVTPLEAMPPLLADAMRLSPSTHFTTFAKATLFRGAGLEAVWPELAAMAAAGAIFFAAALARFRKTMAAQR